jgi:glutaredoxin
MNRCPYCKGTNILIFTGGVEYCYDCKRILSHVGVLYKNI